MHRQVPQQDNIVAYGQHRPPLDSQRHRWNQGRSSGESDVNEQTRWAAAREWRAGWTLVLTAMLGYSISSIPAGSTGVMMAPLEQEFGWSRTEIYSGVSLISFIAFAVAPFLGAAIDRLGPKAIALTACALFSAGIAGLALVSGELWQWLAAWAVIGLAAAAMPTVWLAPIPARFSASRGLAVAVVLSGSGLSTFLVPMIAHALVESHGWRGGYVGLAAIWAAVTLPLVALFFGGGSGARGASRSETPERAALPGFTAAQGFASANFWKLFLASFCGIFGGVALIMNLVPVLVSTGIAKGAAAGIAGLVGIATITGRVIGGWLMDRMSAKLIAALSTCMAAVLPVLLLAAPGSAAVAAAGIVTYGLFGGAKVGAIAYLASRHLGQKAFGTLYGTINGGVALAVAIAPLAANFIYDMTRSYEIVMWAAIPMLMLGALIYASLGRYPEFDQPRPA